MCRDGPIIVIDDDEDDNYVTECLIRELRPQKQILLFTEPGAAVAYLTTGAGASLVLCDMNFPRISGLHLLQQLIALPQYQANKFPVVFLSGAGVADNNIDLTFPTGVSYFRKRHTYEDQCSLIKMIIEYWETADII